MTGTTERPMKMLRVALRQGAANRGPTRHVPSPRGSTGRPDRIPTGLPRREAAGQFAELGKPVVLQDAGRDRRSVASRAVHQQRTIAWKVRKALEQMVERHIQASRDRLGRPLLWRAYIDGRELVAGQEFRSESRTDS